MLEVAVGGARKSSKRGGTGRAAIADSPSLAAVHSYLSGARVLTPFSLTLPDLARLSSTLALVIRRVQPLEEARAWFKRLISVEQVGDQPERLRNLNGGEAQFPQLIDCGNHDFPMRCIRGGRRSAGPTRLPLGLEPTHDVDDLITAHGLHLVQSALGAGESRQTAGPGPRSRQGQEPRAPAGACVRRSMSAMSFTAAKAELAPPGFSNGVGGAFVLSR
jgi:hypothetical protein